MKLKDYLYFENIKQKDFAETLELCPTHICGYINGRIRFSKKVAKAIERITNGKVTAKEILKGNPEKNKIYKK